MVGKILAPVALNTRAGASSFSYLIVRARQNIDWMIFVFVDPDRLRHNAF
jgi:hypothetical protein